MRACVRVRACASERMCLSVCMFMRACVFACVRAGNEALAESLANLEPRAQALHWGLLLPPAHPEAALTA